MTAEQKEGKGVEVFNALEKAHIREHFRYKDNPDDNPE